MEWTPSVREFATVTMLDAGGTSSRFVKVESDESNCSGTSKCCDRIAELESGLEQARRQRDDLSIDLELVRRKLDDARRDRDNWRNAAEELWESQNKSELRYSSKCREELERSNAEWRAFRVAAWIFGTVIGSASVGFAFWAVVELWIGTLGRWGGSGSL